MKFSITYRIKSIPLLDNQGQIMNWLSRKHPLFTCLNIYSSLVFPSKSNPVPLWLPQTPCHAPITCSVPCCFSPLWLCSFYACRVLFLSISSQPIPVLTNTSYTPFFFTSFPIPISVLTPLYFSINSSKTT